MRIILLLLTLSLSSCGFHLRGHDLKGAGFPFGSIYLKASAQTPFVNDLQQYLELYKIKLMPSSAQADLTLDVVSESSDKQILALSGAGQVLEFQLRYTVSIRAYDKEMQDWLSPDEISLQRTLSYSDAQILAKEQEEGLLYRDMRSDAVQQVMRRLSRAKPRPDPADMPEVASKPVSANSPAQTNNTTPAK
jgi:LPS-assembly lipoprotein